MKGETVNISFKSKWGKALISKIVSFGVFKKTGINAGIKINELETIDDDDGVTLTIGLEVKMLKEEIKKFIDKIM